MTAAEASGIVGVGAVAVVVDRSKGAVEEDAGVVEIEGCMGSVETFVSVGEMSQPTTSRTARPRETLNEYVRKRRPPSPHLIGVSGRITHLEAKPDHTTFSRAAWSRLVYPHGPG